MQHILDAVTIVQHDMVPPDLHALRTPLPHVLPQIPGVLEDVHELGLEYGKAEFARVVGYSGREVAVAGRGRLEDEGAMVVVEPVLRIADQAARARHLRFDGVGVRGDGQQLLHAGQDLARGLSTVGEGLSFSLRSLVVVGRPPLLQVDDVRALLPIDCRSALLAALGGLNDELDVALPARRGAYAREDLASPGVHSIDGHLCVVRALPCPSSGPDRLGAS